LVNAELSFIKRVCDPDEATMEQIVAAARKAWIGMGDMVGAQNRFVAGSNQIVFFGPNNQQLQGNPYRRIRKEAGEYLKGILDETAYKIYREESDRRAMFERNLSIEIAVVLVDRKAFLLGEQRESLLEALRKEWNAIDYMAMQSCLSNAEMMPTIPNKILSRMLNREQVKLLNQNRQSTMLNIHIGQDQAVIEGEDWLR